MSSRVPHRYENLDYNNPERIVAQVLTTHGIRFKHGIAVDPQRGKEYIELPDGTLYVPDFFLLDSPGTIIECKDFSVKGQHEDWERKWEGVHRLGYRVILVIPHEEQRWLTEGLCDICLTLKEVEHIADIFIRVRHMTKGRD